MKLITTIHQFLKLRFKISAILTVMISAFGFGASANAAPKVTASIAPIHSITAYIMGETGTPDLLLPSNASPHDFTLKPSQAETLANSDIIIWVGDELESFLEKPIETIGSNAKIIELMDLPDMKRLDFRDEEAFEGNHDDHGHDEDKHDHEAKSHDDHDHDGHDHHDGKDPHIWLSIANMKVAAKAITAKLSALDTPNASTYEANLASLFQDLDGLQAEIRSELETLSDKAYLVYHDAYHYFEDDYGLSTTGVFALNPEIKPGAKKLKSLSKALLERNIVCIFSEPQFPTNAIELLVAENPELKINLGILDPLGSGIEIGPRHYVETMNAMKEAFKSCLG